MNMRIWRATTLAVMGLAVAGVGMAQPPEGGRGRGGRGGQMIERQLADMKERLKLSDDQEKKVKPILEESAKKMMELRQKAEPGQPPSEEMMAAMKKNREETSQKLSEVLSKDQMAEYDKMQQERRRNFGRPGGPAGEGKRGSRNN